MYVRYFQESNRFHICKDEGAFCVYVSQADYKTEQEANEVMWLN